MAKQTDIPFQKSDYSLIRCSAFAHTPVNSNKTRGGTMYDLLSLAEIERKIYVIRGRKVMLDKDLAKLYGVSTRELNQAVKRNKKRFPADFMFQLNKMELNEWMSQFVTSNFKSKMGLRKPPFCFSELGVSMLSTALKSERAIQVNIQIMRVFNKLNEYLLTHKELSEKFKELESRVESKLGKQDEKIHAIIDVINRLLKRPGIEIPKAKFRIRGFKK